MKLSGPEMLLEDRKRGRGWGGGRQEPSSTKGSRSKPAGFQMGTVGEGFSWGGRAQPPSLGKPLRLGGDSCALALLRGVSFSRAHTPRPPETLACSPETPRDTGLDLLKGLPTGSSWMREGEAAAGEQWASVAAGRQALPVNPFLEGQLWAAPRRPGLLGAGAGGGGEGMDKAGQYTEPFLSQGLFAEVIGKW